MVQKLPPLNWLRAFEAAARHLSFTNAAEELFLTQSAISKQVKLLEEFLGQPLFLRNRRGLSITEAGRNYLPTVVQAFHELEQGTRAFLGYSADSVLHVKANYAFAKFWLCPHLGGFLDAYPEISINISTALWTQEFTGAFADVEIRCGLGDWEPAEGEPLTSEHIVPVCAPDLQPRFTTPGDLGQARVLHPTGITDDWNYWAEQAGLPELVGAQGSYFGTFVLTLDMVCRGEGVSVCHEILLQDLLAQGRIVVPFDIPVPARNNYYLLAPEPDLASPASKLFCDWIRAQLEP